MRLIVLPLLLAAAALFAVVIAVLLFVDPNDYRDELAAAVERETGRTLSIDGELGLALLPCCGLRLEQTSLSNPPGFDGPQFARVERVRLGLEIWPLLTKRSLVIGEVDLQGLDVELIRRRDGRDNWTISVREEASPPADESEEDRDGTSDESAQGSADAMSLSIAGIDVGDSRLAYRDETAGLDYRVDKLNLRTGAVAPGEPFDITADFRVEDATSGLLAEASVNGTARLDLEGQQAGVDDAGLQLQLSGGAVPADKVDTTLQIASIDYQLDEGNAALSGIDGTVTLAGGDSLPAESAEVRLRLDGADYKASSNTVALSAVDARLVAEGGVLPADGLDAAIVLKTLAYNLESGAARLRDLAAVAKAAGAELRVDGGGTYQEGRTALEGGFELPAGSPRDWLKQLDVAPPETTDPAVLSRLEANGRWAFTDDALALEGLEVQLDDTAVTGELAVSRFAAPRVKIALTADVIDLDRYLAPAAEQASAPSAGEAATELPREELRDLYLDGTLGIGQLLVGGLRLDQVNAKAKARDGVLTLAPMSAQLYGGRYEGSIRIDGSGAKTQVAMTQSLDAVQVGNLLTDLADVEQLEGLVVAKLNLSGAGNTDQELRRTLSGTVSFELADGIYKGLDVWHEIRKVRATIRGEVPPARSGPPQTEITALDFGGQLANGVLTSERMVAQLPFLRVTGNGALGLADESLDYRFNARVLQIPEFPDGERLKDLEGWSIPLLLGGTLEQPKLGVDLAEFAKTRAAQELQKKLFEKLGLDKQDESRAPAQDAPADTDGEAPDTRDEQEQQREPDSPEDILKRGLEGLFRR